MKKIKNQKSIVCFISRDFLNTETTYELNKVVEMEKKLEIWNGIKWETEIIWFITLVIEKG